MICRSFLEWFLEEMATRKDNMTVSQDKLEEHKAKWETARKLQSEGLTGKEIAKQIGVSPGRVSQVLGKRRTKSEEQA